MEYVNSLLVPILSWFSGIHRYLRMTVSSDEIVRSHPRFCTLRHECGETPVFVESVEWIEIRICRLWEFHYWVGVTQVGLVRERRSKTLKEQRKVRTYGRKGTYWDEGERRIIKEDEVREKSGPLYEGPSSSKESQETYLWVTGR